MTDNKQEYYHLYCCGWKEKEFSDPQRRKGYGNKDDKKKWKSLFSSQECQREKGMVSGFYLFQR